MLGPPLDRRPAPAPGTVLVLPPRPHRPLVLAVLTVLTVLAVLVASSLPLTTPAATAATGVQRTPARTTVSGWPTAPASVAAGGVYLARLTVSGGPRAVHLQRKQGAAWRTVGTHRSGSGGAVALTWTTPASARVVVLRVRVPSTPGTTAAVTRARRVTVRARPHDPVLAEVLALVNEVRSEPQTCGGVRYPAVPPLRRDGRLDEAAGDHARRMATEDFFSHDSPDGSDPGDRISRAGYRWRSYGENIAAGYDDAAAVVQGWLESAGHCRNLMGAFDDIGLGHATDPSSTYGTYWVQDFGTR